MALDVTVQGRVPGDGEAVSRFMFDPVNDPSWIGGLVAVDPPPGGVAVGSRVSRVARFMGRRIDYVLEVEALEPGHRLAMRSVKAPFPMVVEYGISSDGAHGSVVSLTVRGGPGGPMRLMSPLMARMVRRNLAADLMRLRARLSAA